MSARKTSKRNTPGCNAGLTQEHKMEEKVLVVESRVKEMNKAAGFSTSADYIQALSAEVRRLVQKGQKCAEMNGRKTLKPQDL